jgi:hypothetical protein
MLCCLQHAPAECKRPVLCDPRKPTRIVHVSWMSVQVVGAPTAMLAQQLLLRICACAQSAACTHKPRPSPQHPVSRQVEEDENAEDDEAAEENALAAVAPSPVKRAAKAPPAKAAKAVWLGEPESVVAGEKFYRWPSQPRTVAPDVATGLAIQRVTRESRLSPVLALHNAFFPVGAEAIASASSRSEAGAREGPETRTAALTSCGVLRLWTAGPQRLASRR